jgi:hypothetical protein
MTTQRVWLDRDLVVISERQTGLELVGPVRLRPGAPVEVMSRIHASGPPTKRVAVVWTWQLTGMGSEGPRYRGCLNWI